MTENSVQEIRPGAAESPAAPGPVEANYKNYDQLVEERPVMRRRIGGKDIQFPKYLPAKILFAVRKAEIERRKKGIKESDEEVMWNWGFDLLRDILGPENFDHIMAHADMEIVMEITLDALTYYGLRSDDEQEDEEGKEQAVETEQNSPSTPSSSISMQSTPTSSDFTPASGTLSGDATQTIGSETGDSTSLESETSPKGASL
jgi:hypothetical protein